MPLSNFFSKDRRSSVGRALSVRTTLLALAFTVGVGAWTAFSVATELRCQQNAIRQVQAQIKTLLDTTVSMAEAEFSLRRTELLEMHQKVVQSLTSAPAVTYDLLERVQARANIGELSGHYELSYLSPGATKPLATSPLWLVDENAPLLNDRSGSGHPRLGFSLGLGGGRSTLAFARSTAPNGAVIQTFFESNTLRRNFDLIALSLRNAGLASDVDIHFLYSTGRTVRYHDREEPVSEEEALHVREALEKGEWRAGDGTGRILLPLAPADYGAGKYSWVGPQVVVGVTPSIHGKSLYLMLAGPALALTCVLLGLYWNNSFLQRELIVPGRRFVEHMRSGTPVPEDMIAEQRPGMRELFHAHNQTLLRLQRQLERHESVIEELEQARNVARVFIDLSEDSLLLIDREGRVLSCNEVTARWLETTVDGLMGKVVYDFFPPENANERRANSIKAIETGREVVMEDHRNGRHFIHRIKPVDMRDSHQYVAVFSRNITAEAKANAQREDIEHVMRHNLKSPLQGALSLAEVFRDADNLTSMQRRCVDMMEDMARQTLDLVNFMLDMRRMESGEYHVNPVPVDVLRVFRHSLEQQSHLAEAKGVAVVATLDGGPMDDQVLLVSGQEGLLMMLVGNLLANALEASPDGETVRVGFDSSSGRMVVANLGAVPFEIRHRFFEKYVTYGKTGGTGLGTYSVKLICDSLGYGITPVFDSNATEIAVDFRLPV